MPERVISQRKLAYRARLEEYLETYQNILIINVDNVGSAQLQKLRMDMRGSSVMLMGKNTIMRKVLREAADKKPALARLVDFVYGNIGFVFTNGDLAELRTKITSEKVPAAAKSGVFAPIDYTLPPGPTGLDPGQTTFFQALNIATKIIRGSIEILNPVKLIFQGERVSPSAVSLLSKLNIKPFFYGITVVQVYENGSIYDAAVLDLDDNAMLGKFFNAVNKLSAIALEIGYPTMSTLPHSFARAFKKVLALAVVSDFSFEKADAYKEYLADPSAYAAKHGLNAAAPVVEEKKEAAAAPVEEEEESEEEDADFDLFD